MKRLIFTLFASFLLVFPFASTTFAQGSDQGVSQPSSDFIAPPDTYPYPGGAPGFLGQEHLYSVDFRGNGEAVVAAKIAFTNTGEEPVSSVNVRIPKVSPDEFFVYQIFKEPYCSRYSTPGICAEFAEPSFYQDFYAGGVARYQKAEYTFTGDTLTVTLPKVVNPNRQGSYMVYFRDFGYAEENMFGAFDYEFESFKVDDNIQSLRVGISTDSDLVLKGAQGEVDYRFEETALKEASGLTAAGASPALDSYVSQIGYGTVSKSASNLAPLESYIVEGSYADSYFKLFAKGLMLGVVALIILVLVTILVFKKLLGGGKKSGSQTTGNTVYQDKKHNTILVFSISFLSSIFALIYTIAIIFLVTFLGNVVSYQYQSFITIFLLIISICVYPLILFGPGVVTGVRRGTGWGVATVALTVFWLFLIMLVAVVVLGVSAPGDIVYPMPALERAVY